MHKNRWHLLEIRKFCCGFQIINSSLFKKNPPPPKCKEMKAFSKDTYLLSKGWGSMTVTILRILPLLEQGLSAGSCSLSLW